MIQFFFERKESFQTNHSVVLCAMTQLRNHVVPTHQRGILVSRYLMKLTHKTRLNQILSSLTQGVDSSGALVNESLRLILWFVCRSDSKEILIHESNLVSMK